MKESNEKDRIPAKAKSTSPAKPREAEGTWANLIKVRQTLINQGRGRILGT